jgi:hypothetical protein
LPKKTLELASDLELTLITQVKNNQKKLSDQIKHGCKTQKPLADVEDEATKEHGRIEHRKYELYNASPMLDKWPEWKIRYIIKVTRYREELGISKSIEESYYVTNGPFTDPLSLLNRAELAELGKGTKKTERMRNKLLIQQYSTGIRKHWYVENKLNYVKDEIFKEDLTTKRVRPHNFSILMSLAMNAMRRRNETNIRTTRYALAMNLSKLLDSYKDVL